MKKQCLNVWYEAYLLRHAESSQANGSSLSSSTLPWMTSRVYCYISRKHLSIEDFYIKIIPHRLYGFRVRPSTKIILHRLYFFTVDDGYQSPVTIMCKERNVLVATLSRLLLSKIGECMQHFALLIFQWKLWNQKKCSLYKLFRDSHHWNKLRQFLRVLEIANQLLTRHSLI